MFDATLYFSKAPSRKYIFNNKLKCCLYSVKLIYNLFKLEEYNLTFKKTLYKLLKLFTINTIVFIIFS
jgi:hypothetical protein